MIKNLFTNRIKKKYNIKINKKEEIIPWNQYMLH